MTSRPEAVDSVAVIVLTAVASAMVAVSTPILTVGASSLSVMVYVSAVLAPNDEFVGLEIVTMIVSSASSRVSLTTVTAMLVVVDPAVIVAVPEAKV